MNHVGNSKVFSCASDFSIRITGKILDGYIDFYRH